MHSHTYTLDCTIFHVYCPRVAQHEFIHLQLLHINFLLRSLLLGVAVAKIMSKLTYKAHWVHIGVDNNLASSINFLVLNILGLSGGWSGKCGR